MANHEDHDPNTGFLPGQFTFYLGNYSEGSCLVRWDGASLLVERAEGGNFSGKSGRFRPGERQWMDFWRRIGEIGVWSWNESYTMPHGCCGVTYWQLTLSHGGFSVSSCGEDLFPDGKGPGFSPVIMALIDAIRILCRNSAC